MVTYFAFVPETSKTNKRALSQVFLKGLELSRRPTTGLQTFWWKMDK